MGNWVTHEDKEVGWAACGPWSSTETSPSWAPGQTCFHLKELPGGLFSTAGPFMVETGCRWDIIPVGTWKQNWNQEACGLGEFWVNQAAVPLCFQPAVTTLHQSLYWIINNGIASAAINSDPRQRFPEEPHAPGNSVFYVFHPTPIPWRALP